MVSVRRLAFVLVGAAAAAAVIRHVRGGTAAEHVEGGILIGDTSTYDSWARYLFRTYYAGIADDVAALAPPDGRVLDVGCGTGQLSIMLAERGLEVTGVDLDPKMVERARANAAVVDSYDKAPEFEVGNAAALPFGDGTFDIVVSTLSVHHWDDPQAGIAEISRVLKPTGRAVIWDLRPGVVPFHRGAPDPLHSVRDGAMRLVAATPWRWPWRFTLSQRIELVPNPSAERREPAAKLKKARRPRATSTPDQTAS